MRRTGFVLTGTGRISAWNRPDGRAKVHAATRRSDPFPTGWDGLAGITGSGVPAHLDIINGEHHDAQMRTTLTLDPDVAARLDAEMKRTGEGMKAAVNRALRLGLGMAGKPVDPGPFRVEAHAFGVRPGVDLDRMNQELDDLEAEETGEELRRDGATGAADAPIGGQRTRRR